MNTLTLSPSFEAPPRWVRVEGRRTRRTPGMRLRERWIQTRPHRCRDRSLSANRSTALQMRWSKSKTTTSDGPYGSISRCWRYETHTHDRVAVTDEREPACRSPPTAPTNLTLQHHVCRLHVDLIELTQRTRTVLNHVRDRVNRQARRSISLICLFPPEQLRPLQMCLPYGRRPEVESQLRGLAVGP